MSSARSLLLLLIGPGVLAAQEQIQNPSLQRAIQAYDVPDLRQVIVLSHAALGERLTAAERARAYELLGFAFSGTSQPDSAIAAFSQTIVLDPDHELDPSRVAPSIVGYFNAALGRVLVVRQFTIDSASFILGARDGGAPIRFTVTNRARVRTRAMRGQDSVLIDSSVVAGTLNLKWGGTLPNGDPVPSGNWSIVVEAEGTGQNTFSVSRSVQVLVGNVDTIPHLTALPGYTELPETEIPARSAKPLATALLYAGAAGGGELALRSARLSHPSARQVGVAAGLTLLTGFVLTLRRPAPRPVLANIQYNRLLREQLARRNADITQQNALLRRQVQITIVPVARVSR